MSDKIIKNPYRGRKVSKPDAYNPEYKRLGVSPVEYPIKDQDEFEKMSKEALKRKQIEKAGKEVSEAAKEAVIKFRNGELSREELESLITDLYKSPPSQEIAVNSNVEIPESSVSIVSSGQGEDLQWTKGLTSKSDRASDSNNNSFDENKDDEEILFEEVPDVPNSSYAKPDTETDLEEESSNDSGFGLSEIKYGEYVLLHQDRVLDVGNIQSIKKTLSNILMDGDSDLTVDDFVVMKRISVKMGIFIDD